MTKARQLADLGNAYDDGALSNRNLIINGAMQVAQRGTSVTGNTSAGYSTVDRIKHNASGGTLNMSQETLTVGQTDIPSQFKNYFRVNATTGDNNAGIQYMVEDVQSVPEGSVTLSFYAKGTNPSGGNFEINLAQQFGSGGSTSVTLPLETLAVTSAWQRFTYTLSIPNLSGKTIGAGSNFLIYWRQPSADTGTSAWTLDITGVQLEVGDTATPFEHRSYGDELAKCQRYFYKSTINTWLTALSAGTSFGRGLVSFPVSMRSTPTAGSRSFNQNTFSSSDWQFLSNDGVYVATNGTTSECYLVAGSTFDAEL